MTEITVTADKGIHIINTTKNYRGENRPDAFRILVPMKFCGICSDKVQITFNYVLPSGKVGVLLLNKAGGKASRLGSYYIFELRMGSDFYECEGDVECWVEFEDVPNVMHIKSDSGAVRVEKHL